MTIFEFLTDSPWLSFFLAYIIIMGILRVFQIIFNRPIRLLNIRKHGYPPKHCDVDGDFKLEEEK